jgi:hypothetical protein
MPLALMVQPLALDLAEELIQVKYFNLCSPMFMIGHSTTVHSAFVGSYMEWTGLQIENVNCE